MHFLEWKCMNFDYNFTEVCTLGFNCQHSIIGLDNGLAPTRRQASLNQWWLDYRHINASLASVSSLAPRRSEWNFRVIFKLYSMIDCWVISCEIAVRWMPFDLTDDKSTLVQVMAWCRQATSHYLSQCWSRSMSPYGVTRPQWVNTSSPEIPKPRH